MKHFFKSALLTLALISTLSVSRPAKAAVSLVTLNAPMALYGLAIFGSGMYSGVLIESGKLGYSAFARGAYIVSIITFLSGGLVLGEDQTVSFSELSEAQAAKLNISASELESFNAEIDQVNALLVEAADQLSAFAKPTVEDSKQIWSSLKDAVAPETFSAMQKISAQ